MPNEEKIPFARKVKNEIAAQEYTKEEKKWILSGFSRNGGVLSLGSKPSLTLKTEIASACRILYSALKECYGLRPIIRYEKVKRFRRGLVYVIYVEDKRLYDVMQDLEVVQDGFYRIPPKEGLHKKNLKYLLIGCFLANGSVNNPSSGKTSYFLEMAFSDKQDALTIRRKLDTFKEEKTMNFKYIKRRDKHVLYLKKSDQISVFLSYIGASDAMFDFENARIMKDDMNVSNRLSICDAANYDKTLSASERDIHDIDAVLEKKPITLFDAKTRAVIEKRKKMKDANYRELADAITKEDNIPITKSGVVHILRSLHEEAEDIRKKTK